jgi:GNAT superfamily N-acetyltransferase
LWRVSVSGTAARGVRSSAWSGSARTSGESCTHRGMCVWFGADTFGDMTVREATAADVERMVELADNARREYEPHAPLFQRPAANAREVHRPWLSQLVENREVGTFVHEGSDGDVDGFAVITTVPAPPVYDPGGLSSLIDDFAVSAPDKWVTAGATLLNAATAWARERGAVQVVVVSGPHDGPKRAVLEDAGLYVASEWFTAPLDES